jgi:hypothetical protein
MALCCLRKLNASASGSLARCFFQAVCVVAYELLSAPFDKATHAHERLVTESRSSTPCPA